MSRNSKASKVPKKSLRRRMIHFKLCVVRHGETPQNKNNIYQGHLDSVLSEEGVKQTELAGERLKDEQFTHAFSSDLTRAYTTAENILKRNKYKEGLVLIKDPRIREKSFGVFEGKTKEYVLAEIRKHNSTPMDYVPEGGESLPQFTERVVDFFNDLCKKMHAEATSNKTQKPGEDGRENSTQDSGNSEDNKHVLMVFHGGAIRQLFYHFIRNVSSEFQGASKKDVGKLCPNTGISNLEIFVGRESAKVEFVKCTMLFDASHLVVEDEKILYSCEERAL